MSQLIFNTSPPILWASQPNPTASQSTLSAGLSILPAAQPTSKKDHSTLPVISLPYRRLSALTYLVSGLAHFLPYRWASLHYGRIRPPYELVIPPFLLR